MPLWFDPRMAKASLGKTLEAIAARIPEVSRSVACKGTALESTTFNAGGKAFLFVGAAHARFKLAASIADARAAGLDVGAGGWAKLDLAAAAPGRARLARWIAESHALVAPRPKARPTPKPAARRKGRSSG
jgi:hypothetical protein